MFFQESVLDYIVEYTNKWISSEEIIVNPRMLKIQIMEKSMLLACSTIRAFLNCLSWKYG